MGHSTRSPFPGLVALLALILFTTSSSAAGTVSYCSNQNTGSTDAFFWTWQSNGKCTDHCNSLGVYAFAVIQFKDCWCSNYIPSAQVDTDRCMVDCPGFPSEKCGDVDNGLFIYLKLDGTPSGTQGGSKPTSAAVSIPSPLTSSTDSSRESSSTEMITSKPTSSPNNSPTETEQPQTSYSVITESGAVITRTIVVSPTSAPSKTGSSGSGSNTGAIVGGVVGGLAVLLAIVGAVVFFLWRKRKQRQEDQAEVGGSSGITRNTSTMSKAGLLGHSAEKDVQYPPPIVTNFSHSQSSRHDNDSISPITSSDRRYSQPLMIDSRLDPRAVLTFHGSNVSRDSLASIDDSRDYGRVLNVRNPDPETRSNY
ncbi:hypothetical protein IQ07DRAFT_645775 [Pyrenochaeta sp. DS3sAY3a]|nr:hypothetical protein IQ07DRAFT_645775 [Pyrenochaeta sp. DS3sAY3a]